MNLLQMKYFEAVCEAGTVSAAAELLHIAQPSLSIAIKELENEFGTALFQRTHRGMRPTKEGELFLSHCRDVLSRADAAEKRMKELGRNKKSIALGIPPMIGSLILPSVFRTFVSENSDILLEIEECGREETMKKIRDGSLDMALISHGRFSDPEAEISELGSLPIVCAAEEHNPLCDRACLSPAELADAPLVTFKDGFFQASEIKSWFSRQSLHPQILMKTDQLSTMVRLIESGTAVGFLFPGLIERERGVRAIPLSPPISVQVGLVWKKEKRLSEAMQKFKSYIENAMLF